MWRADGSGAVGDPGDGRARLTVEAGPPDPVRVGRPAEHRSSLPGAATRPARGTAHTPGTARAAAPWAEAMRHLVPRGAWLDGLALEVAVMRLLRRR